MSLKNMRDRKETSKVKFTIATYVSGRKRTIDVVVHRTEKSFLKVHSPEDSIETSNVHEEQMPYLERDEGTEAVTLGYEEYQITDHISEVHLRTDVGLRIGAIIHECTHVAMDIWYHDVITVSDDRTLEKDMFTRNEVIPTLIDDLSTKILRKLKKRGVEVTL